MPLIPPPNHDLSGFPVAVRQLSATAAGYLQRQDIPYFVEEGKYVIVFPTETDFRFRPNGMGREFHYIFQNVVYVEYRQALDAFPYASIY